MRINQILLVDDDQDDRDFITYALSQVNPAILCHYASNGRHAIELLVAKEVSPDLILLDLNMPVMDGFQFLKFRQEHELLSSIPVIVHSTTEDNVAAGESRSLGANHFTTKPNTVDGMVATLRQILSMFTPVT
jgi:CheY-like chemotaxis protein